MNDPKMRTIATNAIAATLFLFAVNSAHAADKELLDILLENGAITQAQYDQLIAKERLDVDDAEHIVATLDERGFRAKSSDGRYSIKIGTRLHAEASMHSGDLPAGNAPTNGTELRRARIETSGTISQDWRWVAEVDFADNQTTIKDFWLGYNLENGTSIMFGSLKQPYSLVVEESSNDIPFIERSVDNFMLLPFVDRAVGVRVENSGDHWFAAGGVFGEAVNPNVTGDDEGWGVSGRFIYSPIIEEDRVLHLGMRAMRRAPSSQLNAYRIRSETTHMSNLRLSDTGEIADVKRNDMFGVEGALALGPISVVGEYSRLKTKRMDAADLEFSGWNLYTTFSLTGESRAAAYRIDSGEFKRLMPSREFDPANGAWGAWEIALRYATLDVNDLDITGGEESVFTSGLNWYLNTNIRLMLEWSRVVDTDESTELREAAKGLDIFQFRTQYTF